MAEARPVHRLDIKLHKAPTCLSCGGTSRLADAPSAGSRRFGAKVYMCACGCYASAAKDGRPLGRPADGWTRSLRVIAHQAIERIIDAALGPENRDDPQRRYGKRTLVYATLAREMTVDSHSCHLGLFDAELCRQAIAVLTRVENGLTALEDNRDGRDDWRHDPLLARERHIRIVTEKMGGHSKILGRLGELERTFAPRKMIEAKEWDLEAAQADIETYEIAARKRGMHEEEADPASLDWTGI